MGGSERNGKGGAYTETCERERERDCINSLIQRLLKLFK